VLTAGADVGVLFTDNTVRFRGSGGANLFRAAHVANGVNYLQVQNAATGAAPCISAQGGDTDVDIALTPSGSGKVKFGTYTALGSEVLAGYITIRDAAGNLRKVGVIA